MPIFIKIKTPGVVSRLIMKDRSLSIAQRGLYAYISTWDDDFQFDASDICDDIGESEEWINESLSILCDRGHIELDP